jgi:putative transcriptional regulator
MDPAQERPLTGHLLVATPDLGDGNFSHTVVLVLEHGDEGTLGVVLNRPRVIDVHAVLPQWGGLAADPPVLFTGGPVQADQAVIGLGRGTGGGQEVLPGIRVLDLESEPADHPDIEVVRLFVGYAGWGSGQLDSEIADGGWFVVDADPEDPFTKEPDGLWRAVLHRQGGLFRTVTEDPSLN